MTKPTTQDNSPTLTAFTWHTDTLAQATGGSWHGADANTLSSQRICTDTRKIVAGDIFLALKGDNFDGHDYIAKAQANGAVAAIVSTVDGSASIPQLKVGDTRIALGRLGAFVRSQNTELKVIALTGSSGKTTTKELIGSILSQVAPTLITRGNLNNDLGVPMMLLELASQHQFAVLELGANHVGEIAYTANLVKPQIACVLNIGTAHLGEFGGREAICRAKSEIFSALKDSGVAVVPAVDDFAADLLKNATNHTNRVIEFGKHVRAENVRLGASCSEFELMIENDINTQSTPVTLSLAGEHNVKNALAAAACAHALGIDMTLIASGLQQVSPPKGRLKPIALGSHMLIDDTYNANPEAVLAAAKVLMAQGSNNAKRVLVLGDIGELGTDAAAEHAKLGEALSAFAIDVLVCVGELMTHTAKAAQAASGSMTVKHFIDRAAALTLLQDMLANNPEVVMLFKGSRTANMESFIESLLTDK